MLLQSMALDADTAGLDKLREKDPEIIGEKSFSEEFVTKVIFHYLETLTPTLKPVPVAKKGAKNPYKADT